MLILDWRDNPKPDKKFDVEIVLFGFTLLALWYHALWGSRQVGVIVLGVGYEKEWMKRDARSR